MKRLWAAALLLAAATVNAEPIDLQRALAMAMEADPRIEERAHLVDAARALLQEAEGHLDWSLDSNSLVGIGPQADGNIFEGGECTPGRCELRDDRYDLNNGFSPWFFISVSLIKPLNTFGKVENYADAAKANIRIKTEDVRLQRASIVMEVKRAYHGYLAARDSRLLLDDVNRRLQGAVDLLQQWLDNGEGDVALSDLYALQSGQALVQRFRAQAAALENIALAGLKVVTGVGMENDIEVADRRLRPLPLPQVTLTEAQQRAMEQRPEMKQLEAGLKARRSLVEAQKSEARPNLYTGVVGALSFTPGRENLANPFIYDPLNERALTPVLGLQWNWSPGVADARTAGAQAQLNALIAKSALARQGIPFQVAEHYYQMQGHFEAVERLEDASRAARRWMVASYTDFEAGLQTADKVMFAFQGYVMAATDYLQTTFEYNMKVAALENAMGVEP